MTGHGSRRAAEDLRGALLDLLSNGRAITTAELRSRLCDRGFEVPIERVYRQLAALARRGRVRRIRHGGRHVYWVRQQSVPPEELALGSPREGEHEGRRPGRAPR